MTWTPSPEESTIRVRFNTEDSQFVVESRVVETAGNRRYFSGGWLSLKDVGRVTWRKTSSYPSLNDACVDAFFSAVVDGSAIESIDIGGYDPLGPEVTAVRRGLQNVMI